MATITTPGETIDAVVTEAGVAVNPRRDDLRERLLAAGLPVVPIDQLRAAAARAAGVPAPLPPEAGERIVGVVEYRDGTVIDVVRQTVPGQASGPSA